MDTKVDLACHTERWYDCLHSTYTPAAPSSTRAPAFLFLTGRRSGSSCLGPASERLTRGDSPHGSRLTPSHPPLSNFHRTTPSEDGRRAGPWPLTFVCDPLIPIDPTTAWTRPIAVSIREDFAGGAVDQSWALPT